MMIDIILIETIYLLLVAGPSFFIFSRVNSLYRFSRYKGLRYFSYAFLYLGIGFVLRYAVMLTKLMQGDTQTIQSMSLITLIMEFFLVLPGLLFIYSMIWQSIEKDHYLKGFSNPQAIIYLLACIIAIGDYFLMSFNIMYASQIISFLGAAILSARKYLKSKNNYMQLHLISMFLFMIVWMINLFAQYMIDRIPVTRLYAYLFTVSGCFVFLYITMKLTRDFR